MSAAESAYDAVPYQSFSYVRTHVANLYTLGRLHDLKPPDFRRARVLELGCAAGGNIIPMADQYPQGEFTGIDLSPVQIGHGKALAAELGLRNIELRAQSILDFPQIPDRFDYIICHGTFSWVPDEVQARVLEIARNCLAPNGLALISYNALPGWTVVHGLRDMMRYHAGFFPTPGEKVTQARALLRLIIDGHGGRTSSYRSIVEAELAALGAERDDYVFHEYLEANNRPFYLHDFVAMAQGAGLAYLCDSDPGIANLNRYEAGVAKTLAQVNDPIRREQYLDFIDNRRFRSSILMRQEAPTAPAWNPLEVENLWLLGRMRPSAGEPQLPLESQPNLVFTGPDDATFTAYDRTTAALFLTLSRSRRPMTIGEVAAEANARYGLSDAEKLYQRHLCAFALRLFRSRGLSLLSDPGRQVETASERPIALPVARLQALRTNRVTNAWHDMVGLDPVSRCVLPLLDGTRNRAQLMDGVAAAVARGALALRHHGQPVTDATLMGPQLGSVVEGVLSAVAGEALLIG